MPASVSSSGGAETTAALTVQNPKTQLRLAGHRQRVGQRSADHQAGRLSTTINGIRSFKQGLRSSAHVLYAFGFRLSHGLRHRFQYLPHKLQPPERSRATSWMLVPSRVLSRRIGQKFVVIYLGQGCGLSDATSCVRLRPAQQCLALGIAARPIRRIFRNGEIRCLDRR